MLFKRYRIKYNNEFGFKRPRHSAFAGCRVRLCFNNIGTDTDYSFYIDDKHINPNYNYKKGYIMTFTMPKYDVNIKVTSRNSMEWNENE